MKKEDILIEVLAWIMLIMIIGFCIWIKYELSLPVS